MSRGLCGAYSTYYRPNDEIKALFETADVRAAVGGLLGAPVDSLVVHSYSRQTVRQTLATFREVAARLPD